MVEERTGEMPGGYEKGPSNDGPSRLGSGLHAGQGGQYGAGTVDEFAIFRKGYRVDWGCVSGICFLNRFWVRDIAPQSTLTCSTVLGVGTVTIPVDLVAAG